MEKSVIGLVAALGVATPLAGAQAAVAPEEAANALRVSSVADLLAPVPNAVAVLAALDAAQSSEAAAPPAGDVQVAQFYHHHHHHHHHFWMFRHHHHHHHHHWRWHHHHHHHHYYY